MDVRSIKSKLALALGLIGIVTWSTAAVLYLGASHFAESARGTRQAHDDVRDLLEFALLANRYINAVSQSLGQRTLIANHERRASAAAFEERVRSIGAGLLADPRHPAWLGREGASAWTALDWERLRSISHDLDVELRAADELRAKGDFYRAEQVFSRARKLHFDQQMLPWFAVAIDGLRTQAHALESAAISNATQLQRLGAALAAVSVLLALIAMVSISRAILRPVGALVRGAEAIGRGELSHRVRHRARDEFAVLSERFNHMAETIATAQATLRQRNLELEEAYRLQSEFVSMVSHELRSPLHSILGYLEFVLEDEPQLAARSRKNLENIAVGARRLLSLINDILDFSKLEARQMQANIASFDVSSMLRAALDDARAFARDRAIELRLELPEAPLMLASDEARLRQILTNLLSNAIKFTDAGSVVVRARDSAEGVEIRVRDSGIGIPAEQLQTIFQPFRQAGIAGVHTTSGTGLGLAIVARLAVLIGARVSVQSEVGRGSEFTLLLPSLAAPEGKAWRTFSSSTTIPSSAT